MHLPRVGLATASQSSTVAETDLRPASQNNGTVCVRIDADIARFPPRPHNLDIGRNLARIRCTLRHRPIGKRSPDDVNPEVSDKECRGCRDESAEVHEEVASGYHFAVTSADSRR